MSIEFFSLLDDEGWVPLPEMGAAFDGAMWCSTKLDQSFNLVGLRCRQNFTVPRHHHNLRQLIIVFGGELLVESGADGNASNAVDHRRVGPGEFFVSDAGTPLTMTAGAEGATYIATWPQPVATLETHWYEDQTPRGFG